MGEYFGISSAGQRQAAALLYGPLEAIPRNLSRQDLKQGAAAGDMYRGWGNE